MYRIHPISNKTIDKNDPLNIAYYNGVSRIKLYKFKIQKKKVYHIELVYIMNFVFIKFFPAKFEHNPNKFKLVGMKLKVSEVKGIFYTCSDLIKKEIDNNGTDFNYAFIGQPYEKDNDKNRIISKRFMAYTKQTTTDFYSEEIHHFTMQELNFYSISKKEKKEFQKDLKELMDFLLVNSDIVQNICTNKGYEIVTNPII